MAFETRGPVCEAFTGGVLLLRCGRNYFAFVGAPVPLCTSEVIIALCSMWRSFMGVGAQVNRLHSAHLTLTRTVFRTFKWSFQDHKPVLINLRQR